MSTEQQRVTDPDRQPTEVVVTSQPSAGGTLPEEAAPRATRIEVHPPTARESNELLTTDSSARPVRVGQEVVRLRRFIVGKVADYCWHMLAVLEMFRTVRFFFDLTAAGPAAGFVRFIDGMTQPFVWPFNGVVGSPQAWNIVFDSNILSTMAAYAVIAWGINRLLVMTIEPPSVS